MHNPFPSLPHSGMGVASFTLSMVAGLGLLVIFAIAGVAESRPGGLDEASPLATAIGLVLLLAALANMVALGLGIAALVQAGRNRLFATLGTVFASATLLGSLVLVLLGTLLDT